MMVSRHRASFLVSWTALCGAAERNPPGAAGQRDYAVAAAFTDAPRACRVR
jgi:hypothetical protein